MPTASQVCLLVCRAKRCEQEGIIARPLVRLLFHVLFQNFDAQAVSAVLRVVKKNATKSTKRDGKVRRPPGG